MPFGIAFLQAAADLRTYAADPACTAGIAAEPATEGAGCGVGVVVVGAGTATAGGRYALSVKFEDGARRDVPVSGAAYRFFRRPGTLVFVQVRRNRITLIGDERDVETTPEHPARRIARARTAALAALAAALVATVAAAVAIRRDALARRANSAG